MLMTSMGSSFRAQFFVLFTFLEVFFFQLNDHYFCVWWNCSMKWKQSLKRRQQQVVEKRREEIKKLLQNLFWMEKKNLSVNIFYTYEKLFVAADFFFYEKKVNVPKHVITKNIIFDTHVKIKRIFSKVTHFDS